MGVIMVVQGVAHLNQENIILNFFFGIPLMVGALGAHFLIRRVLNGHTLFIWLLETGLAATFWSAFYYVW